MAIKSSDKFVGLAWEYKNTSTSKTAAGIYLSVCVPRLLCITDSYFILFILSVLCVIQHWNRESKRKL